MKISQIKSWKSLLPCLLFLLTAAWSIALATDSKPEDSASQSTALPTRLDAKNERYFFAPDPEPLDSIKYRYQSSCPMPENGTVKIPVGRPLDISGWFGLERGSAPIYVTTRVNGSPYANRLRDNHVVRRILPEKYSRAISYHCEIPPRMLNLTNTVEVFLNDKKIRQFTVELVD